jgi:hypothetical protein
MPCSALMSSSGAPRVSLLEVMFMDRASVMLAYAGGWPGLGWFPVSV